MDLGIKGKVAVVTASDSGLGKAVAQSLSQEGVKVVICSRSENKIKKSAIEISQNTGNEVIPVVCNVTSEEDIKKLRNITVKKFGACHMLFANAGGPRPGTVEEFEASDFLRAIELNLLSTINLVNGFLPLMKKEKWGRIIASTSISVKQPLPGLALSNVSRAGVVSYIKTLSDQVGKHNITANTIAPGYIMTERVVSLLKNRSERSGIDYETVKKELEDSIPMKKIGSPEDFGAFVTFLFSDYTSYITGDTILIDGGMYRGTM